MPATFRTPVRIGLLTFALCLAWLAAAAAQPRPFASQAEAMRFLEGEGLVKNGSAWISQSEARVRQLFDGQEALERRVHRAELARWEALHARQSQRLAEEAKKEVRDVPRCRALEQEQTLSRLEYERLAKLVRGAPPAPRPAAEVKEEDLRRKVIDSIEARGALALSILEIRRHTDEAILASYEQIRQNAEVGTALAALGPLARLGPLKRYDPLRRELEKPAAEVFTDVVPMYLDEGRYCVAGLAGDRLSVTFEYAPENDLSLLPEQVARDLGIPLTDETPRITLSIGEKKLDAWRVKIPELRFGKHVLRDIPTAVLPRSEAKTSSRLGRSAWNGYDVQLEVERLALRLVKQSDRP